MAAPSSPSFVTTIPQVVTPDQTITFRAACVSNPVATLNVYLQPNGADPVPIWSEMDILPDDVWNDVPIYWIEIPLAETSVTPGEWQIALQSHNADGYGSPQAVQVITVAELPVVSITSPADGATITELPLTITWEVTDATGVSSQTVGVGTRSAPEYTINAPSSQRSVTLTASDVNFADGGSYPIWVDVRNGVGLSSSTQVSVNVHWTLPAAPSAIVWVNDESMSTSVTVTSGGGTPSTASLMVRRINPDGTSWLIGSGLASGDTVTDPLPPLGVEYSYEITAVAASGATNRTTVSSLVDATRWMFNFGGNAQYTFRPVYNIKSSYKLEHGGEAYHFADGGLGNGLPVWYGTSDRDMDGSISFDVKSIADVDALHQLSMTYPLAWIRDNLGHRWRAHIQISVNKNLNRIWSVSASWDAVRWQEAW